MWTKTKRILKAGFVQFWRNGFISVSSVTIMTITLFVIGSVMFGNTLLRTVLTELQDKVDMTVYFVTDADAAQIMTLKQTVERLPEVATVAYVSREQALEDFKTRHNTDELVLQSLTELDGNPLGAYLVVRAHEPGDYKQIAALIKADKDAVNIIRKINDADNRVAIETLGKIINASKRASYAIIALLAALSILVTFNTIRLVIFFARDEISVMKLVGASNAYARGPFIVSAIMYGIISAGIVLMAFYPITFYLERAATPYYAGATFFRYYITNFGQIAAIIGGTGFVLAVISSYLAVRRYLKV